MEGPSPVSALIHAATMVTAGVYLLARFMPLFASVPEVQMVVIAVGTFTSLLAALIALTQTDLKRILAYSTMSQLGYMFMALGAGIDPKSALPMLAVSAAIFHLLTHAFF
jgi:NADH-quinone oxidoreductase subunit L